MQCIRPLKASFSSNGTITFSPKQAEPGLIGFALPCGRCLACLLNRAREKGIRAWHESKSHEQSMFLTLTYNGEHLKSPYLQIEDSQKFIKRLRRKSATPLTVVTTGEYGTKTKRPHWHYLIFGYAPPDQKIARETDFGPTTTSAKIDELWESKGIHEIGAVTLESAAYVARYGAKALGEQNPAFKPYHRTGSKRALGRTWIEKNYEHTLKNGFIVLPDGNPGKIPRYYLDWAKKHQPAMWEHYVTKLLPKLQTEAETRSRADELEFYTNLLNYNSSSKGLYPLNRKQIQHIILKQKFKELVKNWSL